VRALYDPLNICKHTSVESTSWLQRLSFRVRASIGCPTKGRIYWCPWCLIGPALCLHVRI